MHVTGRDTVIKELVYVMKALEAIAVKFRVLKPVIIVVGLKLTNVLCVVEVFSLILTELANNVK